MGCCHSSSGSDGEFGGGGQSRGSYQRGYVPCVPVVVRVRWCLGFFVIVHDVELLLRAPGHMLRIGCCLCGLGLRGFLTNMCMDWLCVQRVCVWCAVNLAPATRGSKARATRSVEMTWKTPAMCVVLWRRQPKRELVGKAGSPPPRPSPSLRPQLRQGVVAAQDTPEPTAAAGIVRLAQLRQNRGSKPTETCRQRSLRSWTSGVPRTT